MGEPIKVARATKRKPIPERRLEGAKSAKGKHENAQDSRGEDAPKFADIVRQRHE